MKRTKPSGPGILLALCIAWVPARQAPGDEPCPDPVFAEVEARVEDLPTAEKKIAAWQAFVKNYPDNPCAGEARLRAERLGRSEALEQERDERAAWIQTARGGIIEPGRDVFPPLSLLADPVPAERPPGRRGERAADR